MEIVDGVTLAATLKHGKIEPAARSAWRSISPKILHAAHEVGVVHRDVKPDNIMIGHGDRVRLLDFGACLLLPRFHQRHLIFPATPADERYATGELEAVGTPATPPPRSSTWTAAPDPAATCTRCAPCSTRC
jgi:serine/threonine protein kinase